MALDPYEFAQKSAQAVTNQVAANNLIAQVTPRLSTPGPTTVPTWDDNAMLSAMFGSYLAPPVEPASAGEKVSTVQGQLSPYPTGGTEVGAPYLKAWRGASVQNAGIDAANAANKGVYDKQMKQYTANLAAIQKVSGKPKASTSAGTVSAYGYKGTTGVSGTKGSAYMGMQPVFWQRLNAALTDMQRAGLGRAGITDGWRSYAAQVAVKAKKGNLAATPGRSIHGLGLAADLNLNSRQQRWLEANAHRYGIHRLQSESWHWEADPAIVKGKVPWG